MTTRVLVVEDDGLLALDIANQLTDAGLEVVGPATSVAKALELLETGCDVALLDVNLGKETAEPVAYKLRSTRYAVRCYVGLCERTASAGFSGGTCVVETHPSGDFGRRVAPVCGRGVTSSFIGHVWVTKPVRHVIETDAVS